MHRVFFNNRYLAVKVIGFTLARLILLRFLIEATFSLFPMSNYVNYSMLTNIYRGGLPPALWGWGNFDGSHYIGIAMRGYVSYEHPFFPLYPWLIKTIVGWGVGPLFAAEAISFLAKLTVMLFLIHLLRLDRHKNLTWLFVLVLLLYPTSFYYFSAYNDGLFFLFATITIYFARKKHWFLSSLAGAVATLTRLNGLVLGLFILLEFFYENHWQVLKAKFDLKSIWQSKIYSVILIPLAFFGYLTSVQINHGLWNLVFTDMSAWGQGRFVLPLQVFWRYLKILVIYPNFTPAYFIAFLELIFVLVYLFLLIIFWRKIRISYWMLVAVSFIIPALTGTFQGMPRYGLHLYPFFLMLTILISRQDRKIKTLYFILATALLLVLAAVFVHGYFVA